MRNPISDFVTSLFYLPTEVQKLAQAEIDTVVGTDRLPGYADRERLPYVNAVVTESLRWHNVAPLGVPHRATEDGLVDGYLVPKGAIIVANLWCVFHLSTIVSAVPKFHGLKEHVARPGSLPRPIHF